MNHKCKLKLVDVLTYSYTFRCQTCGQYKKMAKHVLRAMLLNPIYTRTWQNRVQQEM